MEKKLRVYLGSTIACPKRLVGFSGGRAKTVQLKFS